MSGAFPGQPDQSTAAPGLSSVHVVGRGLGGGGRAAGAAPPRDRLGTLPGRSKSKSWFEPRREQTKLNFNIVSDSLVLQAGGGEGLDTLHGVRLSQDRTALQAHLADQVERCRQERVCAK